MASASPPAVMRLREGRQQAGPRRALVAGISVAIVLLSGSLLVAALLRLAMRLGGASAIADPLGLPITSGAASPASTWGYVIFQSSLLPHPILGTSSWAWGGGSLLLTAAVGVQAFRAARDSNRPSDLLLIVAPALLVGLTAGLAELLADRRPLSIELSPLVLGVPAGAVLLAAAWARLRLVRAAVPWLRAVLAAVFAVPAGTALAAIPVLTIAPAGSEPGGIWLVLLSPYGPNAVFRQTFVGGLHVHSLVGVGAFACSAVLAAVHLRTRSVAERVGFFLAAALLLAGTTVAATPVSSPAAALTAFLAALPGAAVAGLVGAVAGPPLGRTATGHRLSMVAALRSLGDRLPPPPASELTARDMEGEEPDTSDPLPVYRPLGAHHVGRAAVAASLVVVLAAVVLVAVATFTGAAPEDSAPELHSAHAYLDAAATNDAGRIWPTVTVDSSALPASAGPRLLDKDGLARMLAVTGNQHSKVTAVKLEISGRNGATTLVHARYLEAGTERDVTLPLTSDHGTWKVLLTPSAIPIAGGPRAAFAIDGAPVTLIPGQPVAVLPGLHSVEATYPEPFLQSKVTVIAEEPYPGGRTAAVPPQLAEPMLAGARAVVGAALQQCAAAIAPHPAHCPQTVDSPGGGTVRWTLVGDPAASAAVLPDSTVGIVATGVFQMIAAYDVHVPEDVKHVASAGTFRVPLTFSGGAWSIAGDVVADGGSAPRPGAADPDLLTAVRSGFQQCAVSHLLRPADCPQSVPSTLFVKDVSWKLDADPLAGAQTAFDARRGVLTVSGAFSMTVSYAEGGQDKSAQSSGRYRADLLWDGQKPLLVSIDRG